MVFENNSFFIWLDKKPDNWEDRLTLFLTYIIDKERDSKTIKCYATAIKKIIESEDIYLDPKKFKLNVLVKACKLKNDMLTIRLDEIENTFPKRGQLYLCQLYKMLILTGYYGLL